MKRRWSTRQMIFDKADREFCFIIDLCADFDNFKVARWLPADQSLDLNWDDGPAGIGWLNPPYGASIASWLAKIMKTRRRIVALLPTRTNPPWWHLYVMKATEIRFIEKKLSFDEPNHRAGVPFTGHAFVLFNFRRRRGQEGPRCVSWKQPEYGVKPARSCSTAKTR